MSAALVIFPHEEIPEADETLDSAEFRGATLAAAMRIVYRRLGVQKRDAASIFGMSKTVYFRRMNGAPVKRAVFDRELLALLQLLEIADEEARAPKRRWRDVVRASAGV